MRYRKRSSNDHIAGIVGERMENFYQINDKGSPYYGIIQKYRMIQYNMMFDKKNRRDSFFEVCK